MKKKKDLSISAKNLKNFIETKVSAKLSLYRNFIVVNSIVRRA